MSERFDYHRSSDAHAMPYFAEPDATAPFDVYASAGKRVEICPHPYDTHMLSDSAIQLNPFLAINVFTYGGMEKEDAPRLF